MSSNQIDREGGDPCPENRPVVLTGDRPTGSLHLGHYVGSLATRLELEATCDCYIMIADVQALTDHVREPEALRCHILEVLRDYLAVGIDPNKTTIFVQSEVPALFELTSYYLNLITLNKLQHNPTVKQEIKQKNFKEGVPVGFLLYPVSQAADITAFGTDLVPVGADQLPMIELTNTLVRKFNTTYASSYLKTVRPLVPKLGRLPGTDGQSKMGKTLGNAIFLKDDPDLIKSKVKQMYTDPTHLKVSDPGKVEGNPVFTYLDAFAQDLDHVEELKEHYRRGGLGDSEVKRYLTQTLCDFSAPIQERRSRLQDDDLIAILKEGAQKANLRANATLASVRQTLCLNSIADY